MDEQEFNEIAEALSRYYHDAAAKGIKVCRRGSGPWSGDVVVAQPRSGPKDGWARFAYDGECFYAKSVLGQWYKLDRDTKSVTVINRPPPQVEYL